AAAGLAVVPALSLPATGVDAYVFAGCAFTTAAAAVVLAVLRSRTRALSAASEARYRAVLDSTGEGVFFADADSLLFTGANPAFLALTGRTESELRALTLPELFGERRDAVERLVREARQHGTGSWPEQELRLSKGMTFPVSVRLTAFADDGATALCGTVRDLSEPRQLQMELEAAKAQAEEMHALKGTFLANMSHELRTPMVSICGFAEMLEDEVDADLQEVVASLSRSARRLRDTLNAVLDLSQFERGEVDLAPKVVEVPAVAANVVAALRPQAEQKGLRLELRTVRSARALVDRDGLERALTHLVSNALKFTEAGLVRVEVSADSHRVLTRVLDSGPGIDPAFLPHLFEAFRQGSSGMGRAHEGSGLGLTITKRLVEYMGGRIAVDSRPGRGSAFSVVFPRAVGAEPEAAGAAPALTALPRVLAVEDNADTRRLIEHTLAGSYEVDTAETAEIALDLARERWYDTVVVDIHLGAGMDGVDLLRRLREMSAYGFVPALAVTAFARPGDSDRLLDVGFDGYLAKPFTREHLLDALDRIAHPTAQPEPVPRWAPEA
ncbi:MAG: ATP-binding protein, partial [Rhodothermales bacterium]|nr:ATP-binding protein [Rhodothermales bacterium]